MCGMVQDKLVLLPHLSDILMTALVMHSATINNSNMITAANFYPALAFTWSIVDTSVSDFISLQQIDWLPIFFSTDESLCSVASEVSSLPKWLSLCLNE